jgi:hypothetical protein
LKKLSAIFRSLLISIASSFLIGFLPLSPLFAILSGSLGAFFYHTFSILPQEKQTKVSQNTGEPFHFIFLNQFNCKWLTYWLYFHTVFLFKSR